MQFGQDRDTEFSIMRVDSRADAPAFSERYCNPLYAANRLMLGLDFKRLRPIVQLPAIGPLVGVNEEPAEDST